MPGAGRAEQAFVDEAGIDLAGERRGRTAPGDVRTVDARVADVVVHAGGDRGDASSSDGSGVWSAGPLRRDLVHRDAVAIEIDTPSVLVMVVQVRKPDVLT